MEITTPKVIKIAETKVDEKAIKFLMREYGDAAVDWFSKREKVRQNDAEMLIEVAGRACYRSFGIGLNPNITQIRSESKDYFENVLKKGDGSILEHATVTFALMWVSRVLTHQLVRHRAGTAFSQESLRYVRAREVQIPEWASWMPAEATHELKEEILESFRDIELHYRAIEGKIDWSKMSFDQKKRMTSAIRRILPQGVATVIVFTANHRTLRWLIEMRTDSSAEIEIRNIFGQIAEICLRDYPLIYGDFKKLPLPDGSHQYKPALRSKV